MAGGSAILALSALGYLGHGHATHTHPFEVSSSIQRQQDFLASPKLSEMDKRARTLALTQIIYADIEKNGKIDDKTILAIEKHLPMLKKPSNRKIFNLLIEKAQETANSASKKINFTNKEAIEILDQYGNYSIPLVTQMSGLDRTQEAELRKGLDAAKRKMNSDINKGNAAILAFVVGLLSCLFSFIIIVGEKEGGDIPTPRDVLMTELADLKPGALNSADWLMKNGRVTRANENRQPLEKEDLAEALQQLTAALRKRSTRVTEPPIEKDYPSVTLQRHLLVRYARWYVTQALESLENTGELPKDFDRQTQNYEKIRERFLQKARQAENAHTEISSADGGRKTLTLT